VQATTKCSVLVPGAGTQTERFATAHDAAREGSLKSMASDQGSVLARIEPSVDHVRGPDGARVIVEYGDYECPYSRRAYRSIQRVEAQHNAGIRFAFRHFPLVQIHPHAMAASRAAEAAALQGRFWEMHDTLYHRQKALEEDDLRGYAQDVGLDVERFEHDRVGEAVRERIRRDVHSGTATGEVTGTPTLFIDGVHYSGSYDTATLLEVLGASLRLRPPPLRNEDAP
jgi:protein-disulfide isomerase